MSISRWVLLAATAAVMALVVGPGCSSSSTNPGGAGGTSGSGGGAGVSNCCTVRSESGCEVNSVEQCVCGINSDCCAQSWSSACVTTAENDCGACGGGTGGSGGLGGSGGVAGMGGVAGGPPSCDEILVTEPHDCCQANPGVLGCSNKDIELCICAADPACCAQNWDQLCATEVSKAGWCFGAAGGPGADAGAPPDSG